MQKQEKCKRIEVRAKIQDGVMVENTEVYIPVDQLLDPPSEAYTTKYGKQTASVLQYQDDTTWLFYSRK